MFRNGMSRRWTQQERDELARLILEGKSINALAARFGRNWQGIRREAATLGFKIDRQKRIYSADDLQKQRDEFLLSTDAAHRAPP